MEKGNTQFVMKIGGMMNFKKNFILFGIFMCLLFILACDFFGGSEKTVEVTQAPVSENLQATTQVLITQMAQTSQARIQTMPATAVPPTAELPTAASSNSPQFRDAHIFKDDFSTEVMGWPLFDDGKTILKYEDNSYSFQIMKPDFYDWAYFPIDFSPSEISFDVLSPQSLQDGTFGVFCNYQDEKNYNYIEVDLFLGEYTIGQYKEDELIPLTAENDKGQYWHSAKSIKPAAEINHFVIGCYPGKIYLLINNEIIDEVTIAQPFDKKGETAFMVYTFDFASPDGYKVFFDNVEAYETVQ